MTSYHLAGYTACLGIGGYIVLVGGLGDEGHALHGVLYDVAHLQEPYALFEEGCHTYLIGCIEDTGHVAATLEGLEGEGEVAETYGVGLLEGETGQ